MASAEAAAEVGFGDEAAPALADEGGAGERGRLRRKAEEVLAEQIGRASCRERVLTDV